MDLYGKERICTGLKQPIILHFYTLTDPFFSVLICVLFHLLHVLIQEIGDERVEFEPVF